jgi:hypothetical protein
MLSDLNNGLEYEQKMAIKSAVIEIFGVGDDAEHILEKLNEKLDHIFSYSITKIENLGSKVNVLIKSLDKINGQAQVDVAKINRLASEEIKFKVMEKKYLDRIEQLQKKISELKSNDKPKMEKSEVNFQNIMSENKPNVFKTWAEDRNRNFGESIKKPVYKRETTYQKEEREIHGEKRLYNEESLRSPQFKDLYKTENDRSGFEEKKFGDCTFFGTQKEETSDE